MLKIIQCCLICCLLVLGTNIKPVVAQQADQPTETVELEAAIRPAETRQANPQIEQVKIKVAKLGLGSKAKATIRLKDGAKRKGYIAQAGDDDFVIRDRKTDSPTTIRYADVAKVEENQGHSTARNIAIGVGVGVGAFLIVLGATIAAID